MKRVLACPASYAREHGLAGEGGESKSSSSNASREGTIAHALGEEALRKGTCPKAKIGKLLTLELDEKIEQVRIEKDMAHLVAVYVEHCATLAMLADQRLVEQEVHVTTNVRGEASRDLLWGTADFIAVSSDRIDVVDLKFGGMAVEAENNPQLVAYLLGALELLPEGERPNTAAVHIVQPKLSIEPKIWEIDDVAALKAEWLPRFEAAIVKALDAAELAEVDGLAELHTVGEHCHFCPALVTCEHFARNMIDVTAAELEEIEPAAAAVLTPYRYARLVERWKARGTIKRYFELVEEKLAGDLRRGLDVPGVKIVTALGHRKWTLDDAEMMSRLRNQGLKKADFIVEKLVSPAAVEKLIDNPRFFQKYVSRPSSEKLVDETDKRQAVNHASTLEELEIVEPVKFAGGKYYTAAAARSEEIGTSDFACEVWTTADGVSHAKLVELDDQLELGLEIEETEVDEIQL